MYWYTMLTHYYTLVTSVTTSITFHDLMNKNQFPGILWWATLLVSDQFLSFITTKSNFTECLIYYWPACEIYVVVGVVTSVLSVGSRVHSVTPGIVNISPLWSVRGSHADPTAEILSRYSWMSECTESKHGAILIS
jgi:hypothetical protein